MGEQLAAIRLTLFRDYSAASKREVVWTLEELGARIRNTTAPRKDLLPWLKLATFGDQKTPKGSLRHDANMLTLTGVEADYDGEKVPFDTAWETAALAGLLVLVYTSPSHTEEAPRWRVLAPASKELPPSQRESLLGRLNGLFGGIFAPESWTRSQSYYFGVVNRNPAHRVELINGTPIDELSELDECWQGKPDEWTAGSGGGEGKTSEPRPPPPSRICLTIYGERALDGAVQNIITAPAGQQRTTLNREAFCIAQLVSAGYLPAPLALEALKWAANAMPTFDPRRPWRAGEATHVVDEAFLAGLAHPRQTAPR